MALKRILSREKIVYGAAAALVLALLAAITLRERPDNIELSQVQIVVFGDSLCGMVRDETSIPAQVGELMGMTVFNGAFGGTCVSRVDEERRLDRYGDSLSLVGLTKAIAAGDFGVQQSLKVRGNNTEYFEETVDGLERIDFSAVELLLIMHGLNDYYAGAPICNEKDPYDEYTFIGALRSSLEYLQRVNPRMRIVLVTPTYTWYLGIKQTCEEYDAGYGVQEDYIRAEMDLAQELGIEVVDISRDVYPHENWEDWALYTVDGLHPNEDARELLARTIAEYLKQSQ